MKRSNGRTTAQSTAASALLMKLFWYLTSTFISFISPADIQYVLNKSVMHFAKPNICLAVPVRNIINNPSYKCAQGSVYCFIIGYYGILLL